MSDDEDYYEWEEEYLFEDGVPDFVDELAQTSYYEAALYEDPGIDVEDYFSDWEYYSDDYYDEDPTVKQSTTNAEYKPPPPSKKTRRTQTQNNALTTTTKTRIPRPKGSLDPDISTFQSVIWKTPALDGNLDVAVLYEPIGAKVALLKDWREVFKSAQPALDKSRLRKRKVRDEEGEEQVELDQDGDVETSFADDENEFPCEGDGEGDGDGDEELPDSSEQMSGVSMDGMSENGDAGDASNTTPEFISPKDAPPTSTSTPAKRGRKRKAEVPADEQNKDNPGTDSPRARSKRIASKKGDEEGSVSGASTAPVRRSARQRK